MSAITEERAFLDEQEALARAGIERAMRGLGIDLMDALSLPEKLREHELFEIATAIAAGAVSNDVTLSMIEGSLLGKSSQPTDLRGILRRACLDSVLAFTAAERSGQPGP
jgi:hypothetical protein